MGISLVFYTFINHGERQIDSLYYDCFYFSCELFGSSVIYSYLCILLY